MRCVGVCMCVYVYIYVCVCVCVCVSQVVMGRAFRDIMATAAAFAADTGYLAELMQFVGLRCVCVHALCLRWFAACCMHAGREWD